MNMKVERYPFDERIGIYGHESHERLARGVFQDFIRYEEALEGDAKYELPYLGIETPSTEKFRVSTLVESADARDGYAFIADDPNAMTMGGTLYHVNRNGPEILGSRAISISHPSTFESNEDYQNAIQQLMESCSKSELEIIARLLVKMTVSIEKAKELHNIDEDMLSNLSVASHMKADSEISRSLSILQKNSAVEPFVLSALHNNYLAGQHSRSSNVDSGLEVSDQAPVMHILDWEEFTLAVNDLLEQYGNKEQPDSDVNLNYEIGNRIYYIKLATNNGTLSGIQFLCDDLGAWKSQAFDLNSTEADHSGRNDLSNMWSKDELLVCIKDAEIIDDETYERYRQLAEQSLRTRFVSVHNVLIHLRETSQEKPAA